ncbi:tetratricopeptide repeat protein [Vibrio astriarenae]|uniref:Tetratricopeptide repeat protein n=1 Tax=Vibrio astriarenae TaxID=1481923 RepID=A0A7Z2YE54_9VIBR|nr:tetratricopeptide repeat protein [Vibrio astriarenae]QIA64067.1 tetratricopeptide repeat protein [Vibrio astriarenae]
MNKKIIALLTILVLVSGCAATEEAPALDTSLYDGKPVDSLSNDTPPQNEVEAIKRGDAALSSGNYDLALYEYIRSLAFEDAVMKDKSLYNIGRIHHARGNTPLAEKAYLMAVEENPNNEQVLEQLGVLYTKSGDVAQGEAYFYRAINADQVRLGKNISLKPQDENIDVQIRGLTVDYKSPIMAYTGLGVIYDVDKKHELAQAFYQKALQVNPASLKTLINTGYSFYMSGDYATARRYTMSALEKDPNNEKALNNLALVYLGRGEVKRALNVFQQQMDAPEALNNVGYFLMLQGKPEEAIPYLEQAIDKKPTYYSVANENLQRALEMVRESKIVVAQTGE